MLGSSTQTMGFNVCETILLSAAVCTTAEKGSFTQIIYTLVGNKYVKNAS